MVRAMIYQNLKQTKEAQKDFLTAIELGGTKYSEAFVNYAVFLCEQRRYTEAFEYFHTALNNPTYYNPEVAHYNIGMCYARNHQRESAIHELLLAIDYRNPPQNTYIALANLELLDKHFTLANYHINKYSDTQTPDILWLRIQILQGLIDSSKNNATYIQYRDVIATVLRNNYSNSDAFLAYVKFYKQHELSPKKPILFPVKITTPLNITTPVATKQIPAIVHSLRMADTHKQQSQPLYVIVKHGDTLYSIANKYKVATTVLIKINHLKHNIVPLGSKIYLK
jgi:Tfp pilus assembly protein PilF